MRKDDRTRRADAEFSRTGCGNLRTMIYAERPSKKIENKQVVIGKKRIEKCFVSLSNCNFYFAFMCVRRHIKSV